MFNYKRAFLFTLVLIAGFVLTFSKTLALQPGADSLLTQTAKGSGYKVSGITDTSLSESVGKYIKVILSLVGTIFLVLTIYAGFLWMTASGSEEQVSKSISILRSAIIGLAIITSAYSLTAFFVLSNTTANAPASGAPCDLGDWKYDATSSGAKDSSADGYVGDAATNAKMSGAWNKATYTGICALKGVAATTVAGICGIGDIFCLGQCDFASKCTESWAN